MDWKTVLPRETERAQLAGEPRTVGTVWLGVRAIEYSRTTAWGSEPVRVGVQLALRGRPPIVSVEHLRGGVLCGPGVLPEDVAPDGDGRVEVPVVKPDRPAQGRLEWEVTPGLRLVMALNGESWFELESGAMSADVSLTPSEGWRLAGALTCVLALSRTLEAGRARDLDFEWWEDLTALLLVAAGGEPQGLGSREVRAALAVEALFGPANAQQAHVSADEWEGGTLLVTPGEKLEWVAVDDGPTVVRLDFRASRRVEVGDLRAFCDALVSTPGVLPEEVVVDERPVRVGERGTVRVPPLRPAPVDDGCVCWAVTDGLWLVHEGEREVCFAGAAAYEEEAVELSAPGDVWRLARAITSVLVWQRELDAEYAAVAENRRGRLQGDV